MENEGREEKVRLKRVLGLPITDVCCPECEGKGTVED
jgi:hypothetical protein